MTYSLDATDRIPPIPVFCEINPGVTHGELIKNLSDLLSKTIYPAQYEYLLGDFATYLYTLAQIEFQYTGEQSLVNYATGSNLEQLGALLGVERLAPASALTTLSFYIAIAQTTDIFIPKGTKVVGNDKKVTFETLTDVFIVGTPVAAPIRNTSVLVQARSLLAGEEGNRYIADTITAIIDPPLSPIEVKVTNTTIASGGIQEESDDRLRMRIKLAPASFSVAGSQEAYEYFALSASPFIKDVSIVSPDPNAVIAALQALIAQVSAVVQSAATLAAAKTIAASTAVTNSALVQETVAPLAKVKVYVLTQTGLPTTEIKTLVANALNAEKVRPLTDLVEVLDPIPVDYTVTVQLTLFNYALAETAIAQVTSEVQKITDNWGSRLGADIVPEQLVSAIVPIGSQQGGVYGVYRAEILLPAYQALDVTRWARLTAPPLITVVGVTTG